MAQSPESYSLSDLFAGLRDAKGLTRDRSLQRLKQQLQAGTLLEDEVEGLCLSFIKDDAWEAKQGGLLASAEALRLWDSLTFRNSLLDAVPSLLTDSEYRVRKAVASVLLECCKRDGLSVYDRIGEVVLGDIRDKFNRTTDTAPGVQAPPGVPAPRGVPAPPGVPSFSVPPKFLPDTEGWRSLETSMEALEAMMQGCGFSFTPRIDVAMIELMTDCSRHTNHFVREYTFFALKNIFDICDATFLDFIAPKTVDLLYKGLNDDWSMTRYAASVATRAFVEKAGEQKERFYPQLLGSMCLNRHFIAEGVRVYSQDTWRQMCGPLGGARLIVAHMDSVISAYIDAADVPNPEIREAACQCVSELGERLAGAPDQPTPYREHFTLSRIQRLIDVLLVSFRDEAWQVREVASIGLGHFVKAFPTEFSEIKSKLIEYWFAQMVDNIPGLRKKGAGILARSIVVWGEELWQVVLARLKKTLPEVMLQPSDADFSVDETPNGPFPVARTSAVPVGDRTKKVCTHQFQFASPFGPNAPKTFKQQRRATRDDGCMSCKAEALEQLWEASEGMVHLMTELAAQAKSENNEVHLDDLAAILPILSKAFACAQYRQHHILKLRVCERLPELSQALGVTRLQVELPELLRVTATCAGQNSHFGLKDQAQALLAFWHKMLPPEVVQDACEQASVNPEVLTNAVNYSPS